MLRQLFRRDPAKKAVSTPPVSPKDLFVSATGAPFVPAPLRTIQEVNMKTAEYIAAQHLIMLEAGDPEEARLLLGDAGEYLSQLGGPRWPKTADEIYQWCAARRAGEV